MNKPMKVLIIGLILLIARIPVAVGGFFSAVKDPSDEAKETLEFEFGEYIKIATLSKGEYEIWCEVGIFDYGDPGAVTIYDSDDNVVWSRPSSSTTESISIGGKDYKKIGTFSVDSSDDYRVWVDFSGTTLYFTEPIDVSLGIGICFSGVIIGIIGGVIMLVGIFLFFKEKKPAQYPPQQYPAQQYQQPYYPQQPNYPQQQYQQPPPNVPPPSPPPIQQPPPPSQTAQQPAQVIPITPQQTAPTPPPPSSQPQAPAPQPQISTFSCSHCRRPFSYQVPQQPTVVTCPSCGGQTTIGG